MIILDTSFLIDFFKGEEGTQAIIRTDVATTAITYHEIFSGIKHRNAKKEGKFFRSFFSRIRILDYDLNAADKSSEIMAKLLSSGKAVNALDVLIAGIAIANGADKIATRDGDFGEISKIAKLEVRVY